MKSSLVALEMHDEFMLERQCSRSMNHYHHDVTGLVIDFSCIKGELIVD